MPIEIFIHLTDDLKPFFKNYETDVGKQLEGLLCLNFLDKEKFYSLQKHQFDFKSFPKVAKKSCVLN